MSGFWKFDMKRIEWMTALLVIISLAAVPILVGFYQNKLVLGQYDEGARVISLTGVAKDGVWTFDKVDGSNYWRKDFQRAILYLEEGENIVLRLQSADVHHRFYAPELGIGPVEVEPGHTEEVKFHAETAGLYRYYCTSICGDCHFYMQGWIVVSSKGPPPLEPLDLICLHEFDEPPKEKTVARGEYLYHKLGCITCHGDDGVGGITNFNYINKTVPAHNTLAEKLFLEEKEDAEAFIEILKKHTDVDALEEEPDIPRFNLVKIQYKTAKELIQKGKSSGKLDSEGPQPPLNMPSWREILTDEDINSILSYLLTLYEWEEEDDEEF